MILLPTSTMEALFSVTAAVDDAIASLVTSHDTHPMSWDHVEHAVTVHLVPLRDHLVTESNMPAEEFKTRLELTLSQAIQTALTTQTTHMLSVCFHVCDLAMASAETGKSTAFSTPCFNNLFG